MAQTFEAIFTGGSFRPVEPLPDTFQEGQRVQIVAQRTRTAEELAELATNVFKGLSEEQIDSVIKIATERRDFFGE